MLIIISFIPLFIIHKYYGKKELYILTIIYSVLSFMTSFKLIKIFGLDINANIIVSSILLSILYYFINKYKEKTNKKIILLISLVSLALPLFLMLTSFMIPALYDRGSTLYQNVIFNNIPLLFMYPISLIVTLLLSNYCFEELKDTKKYKLLKVIATSTGILFIEAGILYYFTYAIEIKFDIALKIAINTYIIKMLITSLYLTLTNSLFKIKKVKE